MSKSAIFILALLLFFWTAVIGVADYIVFGTTIRQFRATRFARTMGKIVVSEVTQRNILNAGVTIRYSYNVNGKGYRGSSYRYDAQHSSVRAEEIIREFPNATAQTVFYNPKNPGDSVLSPGVDGADLMLILFATPVNVVIFMIWSWTIQRGREKWRRLEAGGLRIRRQPGGVRVRLTDVSAPAAGFYALGGATFAAAFPAVVLNGFAPALGAMVQTWEVVLLLSAGAFLWQAVRNASGNYDLFISERWQTITLPPTCGRRAATLFPRKEMAGVSMQRRVVRTASGNYYTYLPTLNRRDAERGVRREPLSAWGWTEEKARSFSEWLSFQLGVEFLGIEDEKAEGDRPAAV